MTRPYPSMLLVCLGILVLLSRAGGADWELAGNTRAGMISDLAVKGSVLFVATLKAGVLLSIDDGASWRKARMGLPTAGRFLSLAVIDSNIFVATREHGIFLSTNNGGWWKAINMDLPGLEVFSIAANGADLYAGTPKGLFRSADAGASWTAVDLGLPEDAGISQLVCRNGAIAANSGQAVFVSRDGGTTWTSIRSGLPKEATIYCLMPTDADLFAGTEINGIFVCRKGQDRWRAVKSKAGKTEIHCLLAQGNTLLAGTGGGDDIRMADGVMTHAYHGLGVLRSVDNGVEWDEMNAGLRQAPKWPMLQGRIGFWVECLAAAESFLFAATDGGEVWRLPLSEIVPAKK